ncbi:sulfurtransferase TusA family protein [Paenarthrobacter sp. DKR-5]|uniref:sulfurtransferase TusA family protein n=1 Tax=Paenarthrobacter sp. DKR-5 TaxID=2835535 RepID=UPI001BDBF77F|nr:sulfurtransferase TusA family protein [Paenarthrobacter sp. DKR-5]MBT1003537.1 sulfurtransferase TusA family protein [Paenarthrobacter sp. DKR-5]
MAKVTLETNGEVCPFPLIEAQDAMATLTGGDELVINFDCTQATDAIPRWAAENGYPVTDFSKTGDAEWSITVQKA